MKFRHVSIRSAIINALADGEWHYGLDLMREASRWSGRFYPALYALEQEGLIEARFEDWPYPRRRMYRLIEVEP